MPGKVQTVSGLVDSSALGRTITHEHLYMEFEVFHVPVKNRDDKHLETCSFTLPNLGWIRQNPYSHKPNLSMTDPEVMAAVTNEMGKFRKHGGGTIVECCNNGLHRNATFLSDLSRKHGINIVAGAGFYLHMTHKKDTLCLTVEQMVENITTEMTVGCHEAPNIKCGVIGEVGCSWPLHEFERRSIQASGEAQASLKCPVTFHPGRHPDAPEEIFRIYTEAGGSPSKMVMGHLDRTIHEFDRLAEFASLGTYCEYDLFGIETSHYQLETCIDMPSDAQRIARIKHLLDSGFGDKLLISHDIHTMHRLEAFGGHGFSHIFKNVVPKMLDRGFSQEAVDKILIANPATWLAYVK